MYRSLTRLALALAIVFTGLVAVPAQAAVTVTPTTNVYVPQQNVCVADHTEGYGIPVATATGYWGTGSALYVTHEMYAYGQNCKLGYPTGAILDTWANYLGTSKGCYTWQGNTFVLGANNRYYRSKTTLILNLSQPSCWSTGTRRAHFASQAIAVWLGMDLFDGNYPSVCSYDTADTEPWATTGDHHTISSKYYFWNKGI